MSTEQDVNYLLCTTIERSIELKRRWKLLVQSKDRNGKAIGSIATVNRMRVINQRDTEMCALVEELLMYLGNKKEVMLSDTAVKGYEKLVEPRERELEVQNVKD